MAHIAPALHIPDHFCSYTLPIFLHCISLCVTSLQRTCFEFIKSLIEVEFSLVWQRCRRRDTCYWLQDRKFMVLCLSNLKNTIPPLPTSPSR